MSTKDNLVKALEEVHAPAEMIEKAKAGFYHDFESPIATPIVRLVIDARVAGLENIAQRAREGEFDATLEEGEEWLKSSGILDYLKGIDPFRKDGDPE